MMYAALLVQGCDWFGAQRLAAAGVHRAVGNILIYHPDRGLNESTAAADLGNDAISMVPMVCLDCFTRQPSGEAFNARNRWSCRFAKRGNGR